MTSPMRSGRRDFLRRAAGTLLSARMLPLAAGLGACQPAEQEPPPPPPPDVEEAWRAAETRVHGYYDPLAAVLFMGDLWLDEETEGRDPDQVDALLTPLIEQIDATGSDAEAIAALQAAIEDDFATRRTVFLRGWVLAETEVRLAGLRAAVDALPAPTETT